MCAALVLVACALALMAACVGGTARAAGGSPAPRLLGGLNIPGFGIDATASDADRVIASVRQTGVRLVRVDVPWSTLEATGPERFAPGALAYVDRMVADAHAAGIQIVMTVGSSPCWASSAPSSLLRRCVPGRPGAANSWPPRDPSAYAAFVAFLARRYGPDIAAIEVWNEPDQSNEFYFAGRDKAAHYAAVLRAAYPAIKQADPSVRVLGGSLVGSNGVFLRTLYAAGIKGFYDALSVHYYTLTVASMREIHGVQLANGDTKPLWLDEFGWTSCWPKRHVEQEQGCVTAQTQAVNIKDMFGALARLPYVQAAILYKLRDSRGEDFGVLASNGARKPAFYGLARALGPGGAPLSPVRLSLSRRGGHVLARGSAPVGDYMQMEVFQHGALRYRALFILDRFNHFSITLPAVLGTSGLRVRVFQYPGGSGRTVQQSI